MEIKETTRDVYNVLGYTMAMSNLTKWQFFFWSSRNPHQKNIAGAKQ